MLHIRLQRVGRRNKAMFRVIVQEKSKSPKSAALEILGSYNPHAKERKEQIVLNKERVEYWLSQGAQPSNTMHNMLVEFGIIDAPKKRVVQPKPKKKEEGEEGEGGGEEKADQGGDTKEAKDKKEEKKDDAPAEDGKKEEKPEEKKE